jgi:hypothetical protein
MTMPEPIVVLDEPGDRVALPPGFPADKVRSTADVQEALQRHRSGRSLWIASRGRSLRLLFPTARSDRGDRRLLVLHEVGCARWSWLQTMFRYIVAADHGVRLLPPEELFEALAADDQEDLFVAGTLDRGAGIVVLFRGNLEPVRVPLSWFPPAARRDGGAGNSLDLADSGQTVSIGDAEVATHAILYEFDADYRRRAKRRRIRQDRSFGGALRRLRNLRGLARAAFEPAVSAKEVARIESGLVRRPRKKTLAALACRLRVKPEDIQSY